MRATRAQPAMVGMRFMIAPMGRTPSRRSGAVACKANNIGRTLGRGQIAYSAGAFAFWVERRRSVALVRCLAIPGRRLRIILFDPLTALGEQAEARGGEEVGARGNPSAREVVRSILNVLHADFV